MDFRPDLRAALDWDSLGAFITNPISLRRRLPTETPALIEYPGGVLIHSGLPNPGFRRLLRQCSRSWMLSPLPIIMNLMADRPEETRAMVIALEAQENILAVELSFAPLLADDIILLAVEMRSVRFRSSSASRQTSYCVSDPLSRRAVQPPSASRPPRGTLLYRGTPVSGRLFGPGLYPMSLELVRSACKLGLTMIASGGVTSQQDAETMLSVGAVAVQIDIGLWLPTGKEKSPVN